MYKICVLASTSKGNCVFIKIGSQSILIDAGISAKRIKKALKEIGEKLENISAVIISHEHSDHTTGIKTLSQKYNLKFWITFETYLKIRKKYGQIDAEFFEVGEAFKIGHMEIMPLEIFHDAVDPSAFVIYKEGVPLIGYLCDSGYFTPFLIDGFRNVQILIIEANHSMDVLLQSDYPNSLKQRILSSKGHLSNWQTAEFIAYTLPDLVILAHISENNNSPEIALAEIDFILSNKKGIKIPFFVIVPLEGRSKLVQSL